jgi:ADP-ribose pyrophosphatase YjhB (NUDIX family)
MGPGRSDAKPRTEIPEGLYTKIAGVLPILCVDLVIKHGSRFLIIRRKRHPLKGRWWVPGGRVRKGESIVEAAKRKAMEELGLNVRILHPLGYYENQFQNEHDGGRKHTVSIVMLAEATDLRVRLDYQSSAWKVSSNLPRDFMVVPFRG